MGKMVILDGGICDEETAEKLAEIFGRYLRGEISMEECERIQQEVQDEENRQIDEELAAVRADAAGGTQ